MSLIENLNLLCSKQNFISEKNEFVKELFSISEDPIKICKQLDYKTNQVLARHYWRNKCFECVKLMQSLNIEYFCQITDARFLRFYLENGNKLERDDFYCCWDFVEQMDIIDVILEFSEPDDKNLIHLFLAENPYQIKIIPIDLINRIFNHSPNLLFDEKLCGKIRTRSEEYIQLLKFQVNPLYLNKRLAIKYMEDLKLKEFFETLVRKHEKNKSRAFKFLKFIKIDVTAQEFSTFFSYNGENTPINMVPHILEIVGNEEFYTQEYFFEVKKLFYLEFANLPRSRTASHFVKDKQIRNLKNALNL